LGPESLARPLDAATLKPTGTMTGPERLVVLDDSVCLADLLHHQAEALLAQSCGKCTPCREGLHLISQAFDRLRRGTGRTEDLQLIEDISASMEEGSFCQFGVHAQSPFRSALALFRPQLEKHLGCRCRPGSCPECGK
ncbi:MAG: NADH-ubiquinone oxidoreductase-F iron-sulfur binding region domain-containing protein, partial [Candidatus Eisenbacteria bacterium]